ncbi:MAG: hypothetical protein IJI66_10275 [Erysipelotrichaceae bacterium]|nr:hypothetical protein [Erysipelotrichaceae bacterium]
MSKNRFVFKSNTCFFRHEAKASCLEILHLNPSQKGKLMRTIKQQTKACQRRQNQLNQKGRYDIVRLKKGLLSQEQYLFKYFKQVFYFLGEI